MKYSVVLTAKYLAEIEADCKERAEEIAVAMQEEARGKLEFEYPFAMPMEIPSQEQMEAEYKEFAEKHPDFASKFAEWNKIFDEVKEKWAENYNSALKIANPILESIDKEELKEYVKLKEKYGLFQGFNGGFFGNFI